MEVQYAENSPSGKDRQSATNCWATAYEYARGTEDELTIFYSSEKKTLKALTSFTYSRRVSSYSNDIDSSNKTNRFGDVLIVSGKIMIFSYQILHAAVYIDDGLYYEKIVYDSTSGYRLVPADLIKESYDNDSIYFRTQRFNKSKKRPKPSPDNIAFYKEGTFHTVKITHCDLGSKREPAAFQPRFDKVVD